MTTDTALCAPIRRSRPAETPRPRRGEAVGGTVAATMHCSGRPGSCFPSKQILAEGETFAEQDKTHKGGGGIASSLRGQPHSPRRGEESRRRPHRARSRIYTNTLCVEITGRVKGRERYYKEENVSFYTPIDLLSWAGHAISEHQFSEPCPRIIFHGYVNAAMSGAKRPATAAKIPSPHPRTSRVAAVI